VAGIVSADHNELSAPAGLTAPLEDVLRRSPGEQLLANGDFQFTHYLADATPPNKGSIGAPGWRLLIEGTLASYIQPTPFIPTGAGRPSGNASSYRFYASSGFVLPGTEQYSIYQRLPERVLRSTAGGMLTLTLIGNPTKAFTCAPKLVQCFGTGGAPSENAVINPVEDAAAFTINSWQQRTWTFDMPAVAGKTFGTTANTAYLEVRIPLHAPGLLYAASYFYLTSIRLMRGDRAADSTLAIYDEEDRAEDARRLSEIEYFLPATRRLMSYPITTTAVVWEAIEFPGRFHKTPTCSKIFPTWSAMSADVIYPAVTSSAITRDGALMTGTSTAHTLGAASAVATTQTGFLFSAFPGE
jgi:hypothetical protein